MGDRTASYGGWSQSGAEHRGENDDGAQPGPGWERELPGEVATSSQFRALFLKSFHVQRRSKKTICCQLIVPIILVVLVGLIQILFNVYNEKTFTAGENITSGASAIGFGPHARMFNQYSLPTTAPDQLRGPLGYLYGNGSHDGMLGKVPQFPGLDFVNGGVPSLLPNFMWAPTEQAVTSALYTRKLTSVNQAYANLQAASCNTCPASYAFFREPNVTVVDEPERGSFLQEEPSFFSKELSYVVGSDTQLNYRHIQTTQTVMNILDNAYAKSLIPGLSAASPNVITTSIVALPYVSVIPSFDVGSSAATFLFPFAVSFLLPVYMNDIVLEKEERLRNMMVMAGLKMRLYWAVAYLYNLLLFMIIFLLLVFVCLAFNLRFMTETSPALLFLIFFGWGNVQIAFSFFLSTFFNTARVASVIGYILVIASVLISYLLNVTVFDPLTSPLFIFMLYPPFPFYRAIFIIGLKCGFFDCTTWSDLGQEPDSQLITIIVYQFCCIPLYLLLAAYFDHVFPSDTGVRAHPLFFLQPLQTLWRRFFPPQSQPELLPFSSSSRASSSSSSTRDSFSEVSEVPEAATLLSPDDIDPLYQAARQDHAHSDELDPEVMAEKLRVESSDLRTLLNSRNIVLCNLEKTYASGKQAVKGVSLRILPGETFGLLGNNGAGKSTTISMLTGVFAPSSGTAYLCGFDITTEMHHINRIMGVCPQFDHLWKELSVEETILFYARIKGVPRSEEAQHTARILEDIGLAHCPERLVKELSGGMMRRLSVGIAITADPRLIFLDEPTTGLDPVSRSELWEVLLRVKKNRCVILTTHSMSEADYLCNRISIMSDGQLRCLGTSLHLKHRFGRGYSLFLQFHSSSKVPLAIEFVREKISIAATIRSQFDKSITFEIDDKAIAISALYRLLIENKQHLGMVDFGLSMSTLTDVFLRVSRDSAVTAK